MAETLMGIEFLNTRCTMGKRFSDELFLLVKSLKKAEKRNFKMYVKRNTPTGDLKIIQLFDAIDDAEYYDEELFLRKNTGFSKQQLPNLKAHLYKQILASLRILRDENNIDLQLHEQMDYARILYNKGLHVQSLKLLEKIKEMAKDHNQVTFLLQVLIFEKKIEGLHITRSIENRAEHLSKEVDEVGDRLVMIGKLSNLSLQLYGWYINNGHVRNQEDATNIKIFFEKNLPANTDKFHRFYERLYLYQCYCWYGFILQDLLMYYRYCQKWVDLFTVEPDMKQVEPLYYIKGMHNLLNAHFMLQNDTKFDITLKSFKEFYLTGATVNDNVQIQTFIYLYIAKINKHFMDGSFTEGLSLVPEIEKKINEYKLQLDSHRILVFYYKIASLYFGCGEIEKSIIYLNHIINRTTTLRTDLQCYARLLHLIAHYELGNFDLLEYLTKSVYRFMSKMQNLGLVEKELFRFLRNSFFIEAKDLNTALSELKENLKKFENNKTELRAYLYLDVVSWLESKMQKNSTPQDVIRMKYLERQKKHSKIS